MIDFVVKMSYLLKKKYTDISLKTKCVKSKS